MKRFLKKVVAGTLYAGLIMAVAVAADSTEAEAKKVKVQKVSVSSPSGSTAYIAKGKKVKLTVTVKVKSKKKADKKVSYKSANKKIATVNGKGVVKGVKAGKTKITVTSAKDKKKKASIKVVVNKAAVKSVKLNEKNATISVGQSKALKATVAPKKASKKIEWLSSKSSIASVSAKGVVTGKKAGTAVITAKAADGSGKKATFKVTVVNTVNMAAMDVQNVQTVTFALDKPQALTADNIEVMTKVYERGEYRNRLKIDNVSTADNVNYTVVLNNDTGIRVNTFVRVSVPALSGAVKSMEKEYTEQICAFTAEEISSWRLNEYGTDSFTFGDAYGYSSYMITGLPAGLTSEVKGDYMYVKGSPLAPGSMAATLSAVDERGNTLTKTIFFIVGSDDVISGAGMPEYTLTSNTNSTNNVRTYAQFTGGQAPYKYQIINDGGTGATIYGYDETSDTSMNITAQVSAPGNYNITVRATDSKNHICDVVIPVHVSQGVSVGGFIKDASGNPMPDASISFTNKNRADRFCTSRYCRSDEKGVYSVTVSAGVYDIAANWYGVDEDDVSDITGAVRNLYGQDLSVTRSGFDIILPAYKVTLVSADPEKYPLTNSYGEANYSWYCNHELVGYGSELYLKNGTYAIESKERWGDMDTQTTGDWFNGETVVTTAATYKLVGSVTVNGGATQTSVAKADTGTESYTKTYEAAKDTDYEATVGNTYYLDDADKYHAYFFVPEQDGKYELFGLDIKIYDMTGKTLSGAEDGKYELVKGTKYIIGTGYRDADEKFLISYSGDEA